MARPASVGELAPDFELAGTNGAFRLSDHRGERVVLLFYPGDNTPVCTRQFCSYRDSGDTFDELDATVVGISAQGLESHRDFTEKHGLTVALLADTDQAVARAYAAVALGRTKRAVIVIDEQGIVRHRHDHRLGLDFQTAEQLAEVLRSLSAPA